MFGIGETELVLILIFAFMIFGPDKLPGAGRTLGRALKQFRNAQEGFTKVVQTEVLDPAAKIMNADAPLPTRTHEKPADDDADLTDEELAQARARKQETFAERKARLAAEKAAREAAEVEAAAAAEVSAAETPEAEVSAARTVEAPAPAPATQAASAPSEPSADTAAPARAADLYSLKRPQKD